VGREELCAPSPNTVHLTTLLCYSVWGGRPQEWPVPLRRYLPGAGSPTTSSSAWMMLECEKRRVPYLFKLRQTAKMRSHIGPLFGRSDGTMATRSGQALSAACRLVSEDQMSGRTQPIRPALLLVYLHGDLRGDVPEQAGWRPCARPAS